MYKLALCLICVVVLVVLSLLGITLQLPVKNACKRVLSFMKNCGGRAKRYATKKKDALTQPIALI